MSARPRPFAWRYAGLLAAVLSLTLAFASERGAEAAEQPTFLLPWQHGQSWVTGVAGFHGASDAIDFFPPDLEWSTDVKCTWDPDWVFQESAYWVLASAPGEVVHAGDAYVLIDHGGGWFSRYYHLSAYQVSEGDPVAAGERLGHPSTLGECSSGPHVHIWVQGPDGETTQDVELSGIAATLIEKNEWYSETYNYQNPPGPTPTPASTPTSTPTDTPIPTETPAPTPSASPTPEPTPVIYAIGDADCDGAVTPLDAMVILRFAAGVEESKCAAAMGEIDCDGAVTPADAILVLQLTMGTAPSPVACEPPPPPGDDGTITASPSPTISRT